MVNAAAAARVERLAGHLSRAPQRLAPAPQQLAAAPCAAAAPAPPQQQQAHGAETTVFYEVLAGGVALVTLNRPARLNSLTNEMQAQFFDRLDAAEADQAVRVVVVTGAGRAFCAGAEMELLQTIGSSTGIEAPRRNVDQVRQLEVSKPIIAAVNGPCAGLGFVLACMADIRFATRDAKITSAFAKRGLIAEHGISWVLPRVVGMSHAMDLLLSSRVVLGAEAKEMGLVTKVFDTPEQLMAETLAYAREMARWCSPASMAEIKAQLVRHANVGAREAFADSYSLMMRSFRHPDSKEGVASYVQKRDPRFEGLKAGRISES